MFESSTPETWRPPETFEFRGQEIRYGVSGEGEPVVLLHGTPFSSVVWRRIVPQLARKHRVHYFDLLGYGCSEQREGQDVSLGVQNLVFTELLDHWGLDSPHVVGHDFGGTTALRTHLLDGRDYRSLTLIDPVALSPHGSELVRTARRHGDAFTELPDYIHEAVLRAYIGGALRRPLSEQEMRYYLEPWTGSRGQAAFYRQVAQMDDRYTDEIQDRYDEIRCPVTLLWGEQDAWVPLARGRELAERMPHAEFGVVPAAGHLVPDDAPEAVVAAVLDSLHRLDR
ncbi:alpha/beta fold hydrolase [Actinopolyspora saharensis]|uniref:Pimeloyl-ACP methyl ester carboxylesterase n=1 Tax=Actinopolyspora saharensis TaxID=995062 RepID=A0A1H1FY59_9ACTN|nr:alpha/beta hydrolase [Actinopolyspora saharensis]SDR05830.1 Pimeloyl-ACP methyl ester carboxylesterase [Actinopolyspora saharensis]